MPEQLLKPHRTLAVHAPPSASSAMIRRAGQRAMQPRAREPPVLGDGGVRHAQRLGGLRDGQPAEVAAFDDADHAVVDVGQIVERGVDRDQLVERRGRTEFVLDSRQADAIAAPLAGVPRARVIDQDAAHRVRRGPEEMRAALPALVW